MPSGFRIGRGPSGAGHRNRSDGWGDPTFRAVVDSLKEEDDPWLRARTTERVYFLRAPVLKLIKIGYTTNLRKRLEQFHHDLPFRIALVGAIQGGSHVERLMHDRFESYRVKGEWFDDTALPKIIDLLVNDAEWRGKTEYAKYLQSAAI